MRVILLDTVTGERRATDESFDYSAFWWAEGNGSCDCNRELIFGRDSRRGTCLGCERYLIVNAESDEYTLEEYNEDYSEELVRRFL